MKNRVVDTRNWVVMRYDDSSLESRLVRSSLGAELSLVYAVRSVPYVTHPVMLVTG